MSTAVLSATEQRLVATETGGVLLPVGQVYSRSISELVQRSEIAISGHGPMTAIPELASAKACAGRSVAAPLRRRKEFIKRAIDLFLLSIFCVPAMTVAVVLALLIKAESRGPVIYRHERIGRRGKRFFAWKFRTMVDDAEAALCRYLEQHPELRAEWERKHKLRCDPRVTRVGKLLRRTSLDELPQLWNVLKGEMSLVGPRPIVDEEAVRYNGHLADYLAARPGLTGLWQVSGRNDLSYDKRVALDVHYVRNWSVWLDIRILARTVPVVVGGKGAY
jgi:Undecaprenyl-phosphate galactose phosphotransferase WbaP